MGFRIFIGYPPFTNTTTTSKEYNTTLTLSSNGSATTLLSEEGECEITLG